MGQALCSTLVYPVRERNLADFLIKMVPCASAKTCAQSGSQRPALLPLALLRPLVETHIPASPLLTPSVVSQVLLFATPWTVAHQVPLPMEFSRQEY